MKLDFELFGTFIVILMIIFLIVWSTIGLFKCPYGSGMDINGCYTEVRNYQSK